MIEISEIIDAARFKRDGIGYIMMKESYVNNYIRKQVDMNTLDFMVKEYIKAWFRRLHSNIHVKWCDVKMKWYKFKVKIKNSKIKKGLYAWWMFWGL